MQCSGAGRVGSLSAYGAMEHASPVSLAENPSRQYLSMRSFYLVTKYAMAAQLTSDNLHDLRHRFGFRVAEQVPLHRFAQLIGHDSLETTRPGTPQDVQHTVETSAWMEHHTHAHLA